MGNSPNLDNLKSAADTAQSLLDQINTLFKALNQSESICKIQDAPIEDHIRTLQFILQYRLDCQDSLVQLMQLEQNVLQILGVEHIASDHLNLENLAYALGQGDLKILLSDLNALIDKLLKLIYKYQIQHREYAENKQAEKQKKLDKPLQQKTEKLSQLQKQFKAQLEQIQENLDLFLQVETLGPVRDHIIAIQGPISRFHQLVLSGLKQSHKLYAHLKPVSTMNDALEPILQKANDVLHQMSLQSAKSHYFKPNHAPTIEPETLEERAEKRRLGHFFGH